MHLDKSLYNSGLKNLVVQKWDQLHSLLRNIRIQYPLTASCASKVFKLQLPFCLSDPLFYSTSSTVVFCFPSRCFLILTSWLFDHFNFTVLSRFFIVLCFHNLNVVPKPCFHFAKRRGVRFPDGKLVLLPRRLLLPNTNIPPENRLFRLFFSQNRLLWMIWCLKLVVNNVFFSSGLFKVLFV